MSINLWANSVRPQNRQERILNILRSRMARRASYREVTSKFTPGEFVREGEGVYMLLRQPRWEREFIAFTTPAPGQPGCSMLTGDPLVLCSGHHGRAHSEEPQNHNEEQRHEIG